MNDHPGRDTDVRSRPSESTIKDLSFYIGFIKIQSRSKHVGPCFGTNGHSRQDPDMISRLTDTTTQDLSVFIGFRSSNRVKIFIFGENIGFICNFIETLIFFVVLGIILDHFRHPKSCCWYPKLKILRKFTIFFLDQKIDFLI